MSKCKKRLHYGEPSDKHATRPLVKDKQRTQKTDGFGVVFVHSAAGTGNRKMQL